MDQQLFTAVDAYIDGLFDLSDEALEFTLKSSRNSAQLLHSTTLK